MGFNGLTDILHNLIYNHALELICLWQEDTEI